MSEIWNEIARRVRARLVQQERERIIQILENYKLLPTYSKAAQEFSEELWENIKYRLLKEITGGKDE